MKIKTSLRVMLVFVLLCQSLNCQSPYKLKWWKESAIFGIGLGVGITASEIDEKIKPLTQSELDQLDKNSINVIDKSTANNYSQPNARVSDGFVIGCLASPVLFLGGKESRSKFGVIGVMYLETIMFSALLPSYAKGGVQRVRPFVYTNEAPLDEKLTSEAKRSFFSGHTAVAFSSAVFLSTVYSNYYPDSKYKPYVWAGSLLAAGTVGFFRIASGAHFPTDVLAGAIVGSAVGYFIPLLHKTKTKSDVTIIPFYQDNKACVSVIWNLK